MSSLLIIILLFVLQFFYLPFGTSFFEGAKVFFAEALIFLLLLLAIFSNKLHIKQYKKSFLWAAGVLIAVSLYHIVFSSSQTILFGNQYRQQGTFLLLMLLLFSFLSSHSAIEEKIKPLFITSVLFVQFVCTLLFIGVGADRPVGTLGEPNALAATVIFLWPFIVFAWPKKLSLRVVASVGLVCVLTILVLSGSRSGIIALAVQIIFLSVIALMRLRHKQNALQYGVIVALLALLISFSTPFIGPRTEYEDRGEIWKAAVHAGIKQPVLGVGFGNVEHALHEANVALQNKLTGYYVDSAHNIFLDWFISAGLVGLGVLLFFLYQAFKTFVSANQTRNCVLLLGLITALSFNPASVVALVALWWLIGQGNKQIQ